jgi:predicted RNase H-like HicB family nuclease
MRRIQLTIRLLRETDGRSIADVPELPGVTAYGSTSEEATLKAKALAWRVIAEEIEHGEMTPAANALRFSVAAWEDIEDVLVSRSRRHEKRIPLEKVKADLIASGKLHG